MIETPDVPAIGSMAALAVVTQLAPVGIIVFMTAIAAGRGIFVTVA